MNTSQYLFHRDVGIQLSRERLPAFQSMWYCIALKGQGKMFIIGSDWLDRGSNCLDLVRLANVKHWPNSVLMLGQRRRRWHNIKTALVE